MQLCLGHTNCPTQTQRETGKWGRVSLPQSSDPTASREFCLDDVQEPVHTTQRVTIPLVGTISIHGNTGVWGDCMQVHLLAEAAQGPALPTSMIPTATYGELCLGSSQVPTCLRKLSAHSIEFPAKAVVSQDALAN